MKLTELKPMWISGGGEGVNYRPPGTSGQAVQVRSYTAGVEFDCPCGACGKRRYVPFQNPPELNSTSCPDSKYGWHRTGTTFEDLTLRPAIYAERNNIVPDNCGWHGFITDGEVAGHVE